MHKKFLLLKQKNKILIKQYTYQNFTQGVVKMSIKNCSFITTSASWPKKCSRDSVSKMMMEKQVLVKLNTNYIAVSTIIKATPVLLISKSTLLTIIPI